ncbi:TetR/AcrR family transcriptional regulator [uncultured Phenylobacterium sp.]|uniref:TetR/AcrR family transcriptional regulator n=1 Tax=uncultured Phenylobacterium sp. TaxID=349273 RepID=UPI0025EE2EAC|nr:TetR/AcrR family transcriptional regulator [uncultured Phenylobacterium sp.]
MPRALPPRATRDAPAGSNGGTEAAPSRTDGAVAAEPPLSRREAGKAERRGRIIQAARDLIRETGNAGLSMRALASRAGVGLGTPYYLFGSKRAIALVMLNDVRGFRIRFAHLTLTDPLDRLFAAVDIAVGFYVEDPPFYRTLWAAVFDPSDDVRREIYNESRDEFWQSLIADTAKAGILAPSVHVELLFRALDRAFASVMLAWVMGELTSEQLAPNIRYGYALVLTGAAAPSWRARLDARLLENQALILAAARA